MADKINIRSVEKSKPCDSDASHLIENSLEIISDKNGGSSSQTPTKRYRSLHSLDFIKIPSFRRNSLENHKIKRRSSATRNNSSKTLEDMIHDMISPQFDSTRNSVGGETTMYTKSQRRNNTTKSEGRQKRNQSYIRPKATSESENSRMDQKTVSNKSMNGKSIYSMLKVVGRGKSRNSTSKTRDPSIDENTTQSNEHISSAIQNSKPTKKTEEHSLKKIDAMPQETPRYLSKWEHQKVLESYVPDVVLDWIESYPNNNANVTSRCDVTDCAVVLADISGFTPLTEKFCKEPDGAERLSDVLNDYFGTMIDIIYMHGGDVVKFAGDALLVVWRPIKPNDREKYMNNTFVCNDPSENTSNVIYGEVGEVMEDMISKTIQTLEELETLNDKWLHTAATTQFVVDDNITRGICHNCEYEVRETIVDYTRFLKPVLLHCISCGEITCSNCLSCSIRDARVIWPIVPASSYKTVSICRKCFIDDSCTNISTMDSVSLLSYRCIQSCLELMKQLDGRSGLRLHMGVGSGEVKFLHIGGLQNRWEFVLAGDAMRQMAIAEPESKSGEICVSQETWHRIQDRCTGIAVEDSEHQVHVVNGVTKGVPVLPSPRRWVAWSVPDEYTPRIVSDSNLGNNSDVGGLIMRYIPGAIRLKLGKSNLNSTYDVSEIRCVSVLFINLPSLDYSIKDCLKEMQDALTTLQSVLYEFEGSLRQFIVDDKGTTMIAVFGLYPFSHENDAYLAVKCAMRFELTFNRKVSVGITSGNVFVGGVGSSKRKEYAVVGDIVNLSARLMVAGLNIRKEKLCSIHFGIPFNVTGKRIPNPVICDLDTYKNSKRYMQFKRLPPIKVKGKTNEILVFTPVKEYEEQLSSIESSSDIIGQEKVIDIFAKSLKCFREKLSKTTTNIIKTEEVIPSIISRSSTNSNNSSSRRGSAVSAVNTSFGPNEIIVIDGSLGIGKTKLISKLVSIVSDSGSIKRDCNDIKGGGKDNNNSNNISSSSSSREIVVLHGNADSMRQHERENPFHIFQSFFTKLANTIKTIEISPNKKDLLDTKNLGSVEGSNMIDDCSSSNSMPLIADEKIKIDVRLITKYLSKKQLRFLPILYSFLPNVELNEAESRDSTRTQNVTGKVRVDIATKLFYKILVRYCKVHHVLFVFENAQWLDRYSLNLILQMLRGFENERELKSFVIAVTMRPLVEEQREIQKKNLSRLLNRLKLVSRDCFNVHFIHLEPLSQEDTASLITLHLKLKCDPLEIQRNIVDVVFSQSGGNPLFIIEVIDSMLAGGYISVTESGQLHHNLSLDGNSNEDSAMELPNSLQGILSSRIDSLDQRHVLVIQLCSVIGEQSSLVDELLLLHLIKADITGVDAAVSLADIDILITKGFLVVATGEMSHNTSQRILQFKNPVLCKVAYNMMSFAKRRRYHVMIAQYTIDKRKSTVVSKENDNLIKDYRVIVYHYLKGAENEKALYYAKTLSDICENNFDHKGACKYLNQTKKIQIQELEKINSVYRLGLNHYQLNNLLLSHSYFERVIKYHENQRFSQELSKLKKRSKFPLTITIALLLRKLNTYRFSVITNNQYKMNPEFLLFTSIIRRSLIDIRCGKTSLDTVRILLGAINFALVSTNPQANHLDRIIFPGMATALIVLAISMQLVMQYDTLIKKCTHLTLLICETCELPILITAEVKFLITQLYNHRGYSIKAEQISSKFKSKCSNEEKNEFMIEVDSIMCAETLVIQGKYEYALEEYRKTYTSSYSRGNTHHQIQSLIGIAIIQWGSGNLVELEAAVHKLNKVASSKENSDCVDICSKYYVAAIKCQSDFVNKKLRVDAFYKCIENLLSSTVYEYKLVAAFNVICEILMYLLELDNLYNLRQINKYSPEYVSLKRHHTFVFGVKIDSDSMETYLSKLNNNNLFNQGYLIKIIKSLLKKLKIVAKINNIASVIHHRLQGMFLWRNGHFSEGTKQLKLGRKMALKYGYQYEYGKCLFELGKFAEYTTNPMDRRIRCLNKAEKTFTSINQSMGYVYAALFELNIQSDKQSHENHNITDLGWKDFKTSIRSKSEKVRNDSILLELDSMNLIPMELWEGGY